jgi:hypothetical protein
MHNDKNNATLMKVHPQFSQRLHENKGKFIGCGISVLTKNNRCGISKLSNLQLV